jgi:hypothetical protein
VVQESVYKRSVGISFGRMHDEALLLVHHDESFVFVDDVQIDFLRQNKRLRRRWKCNIQTLPALQLLLFRPLRLPIDGDAAFGNQLLQVASG